jgi:molybdate transport system substrate-binding protein
MTTRSRIAAWVAASCLGVLMVGAPADAAEITVTSATAMRELLQALVPQFEQASGNKVTMTFQSSVETSAKLEKGAVADLVVTSPEDIDRLIKDGKVAPGSSVPFTQSGVGVAVRPGAPKPDISTPDAFKKTLLAAKSVGISQGPSGVYLMSLLQKMGIADQIKPKAVFTKLGQRVGPLVVSGKVEIGVQQVTELLATPGINFVGPLPKELQT